jgi:mono/diheme cytochrome c family protein
VKHVPPFLIMLTIFVVGCSLAGDVTPPPDLATMQAAQPALETITQSPTTAPLSLEEPAPLPSAAPTLKSGEAIYVQECAACHGLTGLGDGELAANLEVPPSPLGDPDFAFQAVPAVWYDVVTQGRMDRFMPPFVRLDDAERWDVVAYALSLSITPAEIALGESLFASLCTDCHGRNGSDGAEAPDLTDLSFMVEHSVEDIYVTLTNGMDKMPSFNESLNEEERWSLSAFVRTLSYASDAVGEMATEAVSEAVQRGTVRGVVVNGTPGGPIPTGEEITLVGIDGMEVVMSERGVLDQAGEVIYEEIELVPGRIYGIFVEHQGVQYFSEAFQTSEGESDLVLPVMIYEATGDSSQLHVERLHILFDLAVEDQVEVTQVWVLSNRGDKTFVSLQATDVMEIPLPQGFENLTFFGDDISQGRFVVTDLGFIDRDPIRPAEATELVFRFSLPFERRLAFEQTMALPVEAITILMPEDGPAVQGEGLSDEGVRDIGGVPVRNYSRSSLSSGDTLALNLSVSPLSVGSRSSLNGVLIGAGVLGLVVVALGLWWYRTASTESRTSEREGTPGEIVPDREALLRAIAALDDDFEAGEIPEKAYRQRREELKRQALTAMRGADD